MTIGQKLKKLRTDKGSTQKDLADELHVSFQTVSKWENDENEPDIATLKELAKFYGCSVDYLIDESDAEIKEEEPEAKEAPSAPAVKMSGHICEKCHKDIPEGDVYVDRVAQHHRSGRHTYTTYKEVFYHKKCFDQKMVENKISAEQTHRYKANRARKKSFGWAIAGGIVALAISLIAMLTNDVAVVSSIFGSLAIGYGIFAAVYCIIAGSYILDVFVHVATWSIHFPGLIFSFDLGGFAWLIVMKILFAIIGFLFGVFVLALAVALSAALAAISFPFICIHNERNGYIDAL